MTSSSISLKDIMPEYPNWDQQIAINSAQTTQVQLGGIDSSGNFIDAEENILKKIDFQSIAGHSTEQLASIENLFQQKVTQYLDDTGSVILMNDLANANKFSNLTVSNETKRLSRLREKSASDLVKSRSSYLSKQYTISYNRFLTSIVQLSFALVLIIAICVYCIIPTQILNLWTFGWIVGIVVALYIIVLILMIKSMQARRKDDWNKYYFFKSTNSN